MELALALLQPPTLLMPAEEEQRCYYCSQTTNTKCATVGRAFLTTFLYICAHEARVYAINARHQQIKDQAAIQATTTTAKESGAKVCNPADVCVTLYIVTQKSDNVLTAKPVVTILPWNTSSQGTPATKAETKMQGVLTLGSTLSSSWNSCLRLTREISSSWRTTRSAAVSSYSGLRPATTTHAIPHSLAASTLCTHILG